jgi:hypothetical protein
MKMKRRDLCYIGEILQRRRRLDLLVKESNYAIDALCVTG